MGCGSAVAIQFGGAPVPARRCSVRWPAVAAGRPLHGPPVRAARPENDGLKPCRAFFITVCPRPHRIASNSVGVLGPLTTCTAPLMFTEHPSIKTTATYRPHLAGPRHRGVLVCPTTERDLAGRHRPPPNALRDAGAPAQPRIRPARRDRPCSKKRAGWKCTSGCPAFGAGRFTPPPTCSPASHQGMTPSAGTDAGRLEVGARGRPGGGCDWTPHGPPESTPSRSCCRQRRGRRPDNRRVVGRENTVGSPAAATGSVTSGRLLGAAIEPLWTDVEISVATTFYEDRTTAPRGVGPENNRRFVATIDPVCGDAGSRFVAKFDPVGGDSPGPGWGQRGVEWIWRRDEPDDIGRSRSG